MLFAQIAGDHMNINENNVQTFSLFCFSLNWPTITVLNLINLIIFFYHWYKIEYLLLIWTDEFQGESLILKMSGEGNLGEPKEKCSFLACQFFTPVFAKSVLWLWRKEQNQVYYSHL